MSERWGWRVTAHRLGAERRCGKMAFNMVVLGVGTEEEAIQAFLRAGFPLSDPQAWKLTAERVLLPEGESGA